MLLTVVDHLDLLRETAPVQECPECRKLEIHLENLKCGLEMEKLELFTKEFTTEERDRRFELVLQLMQDLDLAQHDYFEHRKTHLHSEPTR
jgi:hypothetical protein